MQQNKDATTLKAMQRTGKNVTMRGLTPEMTAWLESILRTSRKSVVAAILALASPTGSLNAQGTAQISAPFTVDAIFTSANSIPLTTPEFTASGKSVGIELRFAPPVGTMLTVVQNTSLNLIDGTFDNLSQGQKVFLTFDGASYPYVANYYGGSGNDLVLQPANTTCLTWGDTPNGTTQSLNTGILAGKTIVQVAATSHTLILCADGTLAALGSNTYGQLGDGTKTAASVPRLVSRAGVLKDKIVIAIAAGWTFSVALCSDGTIATWGDNFFSSLGNGNTTSSNLPVEVVRTGVLAGKKVTAISAGYYHVLGICTDGTVVAWGRGTSGQLGDSLRTSSTVPVRVNTAGVLRNKTVVAIGGGQNHSLALCSDGTLAAWGNNDNRQLGNGADSGANYIPMPVNQSGVLAGKTVVSITCGNYHNFAHCSDGTLASWGSNSQGQLGINLSGGYASLPALVDLSGPIAGKTITSVAAGAFHSLATCSDGSMFFWGGLTSSARAPVPSQESARSGSKSFIKVASAASSQISVGFLAAPPPPNQNPTFSGYAVKAKRNTTISIGNAKLLTRAADPDGGSPAISSVEPISSQGGRVTRATTGVTYTPPNNFIGLDTFTLTITDGQGGSVVGTVTANVGASSAASGNLGSQITVQPGGTVSMIFYGIPGQTYQIQRSTDMLNWIFLQNITAASDGTLPFTDPNPPVGAGFYRTSVP
jgi:alpha-tubulin suppressor-like RCC1 family protein